LTGAARQSRISKIAPFLKRATHRYRAVFTTGGIVGGDVVFQKPQIDF
jgi:hypothetical protein